MPSTYAHYRFGQSAAELLDGSIAKAVRRFRPLFDVGLHGPDLFFYFNPLFKTKTGSLGYRFHRMTGKAFFEDAAARLRQSPSEGGTAYLFGVLAHYALDSACHSTIRQLSAEGTPGHVQLETEFDRFLLSLDGKTPAHLQDTGTHLHLTRGEIETAAACYPDSTPVQIRISLTNMRLIHKALATRKRKLLAYVFGFGGRHGREMIMSPTPDPECSGMAEQLLALYSRGLEAYGSMAAQLAQCLENGTELDELFAPVFE